MPYLALNEHVEEVVAGLLKVSLAHQVTQVILGDPQTWEAPDVDPLVVQAAALSAGDQVKQLLCLGGGGDGGIWRRRPAAVVKSRRIGPKQEKGLITDRSCH